MKACPSDEDLIRLASGGLSSEESRDMWRHLDQCSACQASLRALGEVFQSCAIVVAEDEESRDQELRRYAEFKEALRTRARSEQRNFVTLSRILPAAAFLLAVILPVVVARTTQYDAGRVVQRAVEHEMPASLAGDPDEPFRSRWIPEHQPGVSVKAGASSRNGPASRSPTEVTDPASEIVRLLDSHGFSRGEPLSASRLAAWRAALPAHSDRVVRRRGLFYVQTTVPRGQLREVVVVIREDDWQVVGLAWTFSGLGRFQLERHGADAFSSWSQPGAPRKGDTQ